MVINRLIELDLRNMLSLCPRILEFSMVVIFYQKFIVLYYEILANQLVIPVCIVS